MNHYGAICPHSGGLPAEDFEVDAESLPEAHTRFWQMCVGSRYVSLIYEKKNGEWIQVWKEGQPLYRTEE